MPQKPESRLQKKQVDRLVSLGAWAVKIHGSPLQRRGLPDIMGCHVGIMFGVESKTPQNKKGLTELQRRTLEKIKKAGGVAGVATTVEAMDRVIQLCEQKAGVR